MRFKDELKKLDACSDAVKWVGGKSFKTAWAECKRADWMLWYICMAELGTKRDRTHIICDCAETALKYVLKGEDRPRLAIEAARTYADNPTEENREKLNTARYAAGDAAGAAAGDAGAAAGAAAHKQMLDMIREKFKINTKERI